MKPGDLVRTPHGEGRLLHPNRRRARKGRTARWVKSGWVVLIGKHGIHCEDDEIAPLQGGEDNEAAEGER